MKNRIRGNQGYPIGRMAVSPIRGLLCLAAIVAVGISAAAAQGPPIPGRLPVQPPTRPVPAKKAPARTPSRTAKEEPKKPPAPESLYLETKDYWKIHCTYYAPLEGVRKGKEIIPLIMLHGWGGQGSDYSWLASSLQKTGYFAVIVPDLRGHGRSKTRRMLNGDMKEVEYDKFRLLDKQQMFLDVEAVKKYMIGRNNEGLVNIDLLGVVGADLGCILALNWSAYDWSKPQGIGFKQGQDVKALIMLSPDESMQGLTAREALQALAVIRTISVLIAVGASDRPAYSDASRVNARFKRFHPEPEGSREERRRKQSLVFVKAPTGLQGTKLLTPELPVVEKSIKGFLYYRLVLRGDQFPWKERKNPLTR